MTNATASEQTPPPSGAPPTDRDLKKRYPWVAALAFVLLFGWSAYQQLDNLLAGMHIDGEPSATIETLTGGAIGWSTPGEIEGAVDTWEAWDKRERGVGQEAALGDVERLHESPTAIVGAAAFIDSLLILLPYLIVLLFAAQRLEQRIGDPGWLKAIKPIRWFIIVGAAFDLLENILVYVIVANDGWTNVARWALVLASRAKWWALLVGMVGLLYVALLRPEEGGTRWASQIPAYLRGFGAIRVALVTAILTWVFVSGPLFGDQMSDVIRRWTWLHFLLTAFFVVMVSSFTGVSARRVRLRIITKTRRWNKLSYSPPVSLSDEEIKQQRSEFFEAARGRTQALGRALVVLGLFGLVSHAVFGFGRGLVVPAALTLVFVALGWVLPQPPDGLTATASRPRVVSERTPRSLAAAIPLVVGLGIISAVVPEYALSSDRSSPWPLLFILAVVGLAVLVYRRIDGFARKLATKESEDPYVLDAGSKILGGVTIAIILLVVLTLLADVPEGSGAISAPWLIVVGSFFVALGFVAFYFFAEPDETVPEGEAPRPSPAVMIPGTSAFGVDTKSALRIVVVFATGAMVLWLYIASLDAPRIIGAVAFALTFVFLAGLLAETISRFVEGSVPPKVLVYLGIKRTPFLVLGIFWIWVMATWLPNVGFHDVEVIEAVAAERTEPMIDEVLDRWLEENDLPTLADLESSSDATTTDAVRQAHPMVFVSAWGGGIRAAVWTAYVLDCALEPHESPHPWDSTPTAAGQCRVAEEAATHKVVAMSGISGGSLGFAQYLAEKTSEDPGEAHAWVAERMGDDYLSPTLARLLYVDIPSAFYGTSDRYRDRGDLLRQAWESSWGEDGALERGIFDLWANEPGLPLAVMNGTSMNDSCATNGSVLVTRADTGKHALECTTLAPFDLARSDVTSEEFSGAWSATHDIGRILCEDQDLSLSAAALTSARFPLISPSGRLVQCAETEGRVPDAVYVTDGGQLELSGTLTATQLWESMEPLVARWNALNPTQCIAPMLIHMENGFSEDTSALSASPPNEWTGPALWSFLSAKGGLVGNARQRAALEFSEPLGEQQLAVHADGKEIPRFAYVRTRAHPGATAPLGWTLSPATLDDLAAQLGQNLAEFRLINTWLEGELECVSS